MLLCTCARVGNAQTTAADDASSTFRIFLTDGRALPAYGEAAIVGGRVVFSLLVGGGSVAPSMQLVSLPVSAVDVDRTTRYARAVRAAYYAATSGEAEYRAVTSGIASTLDAIPAIPDAALRLQLAQEARDRLTTWSADHYDFHAAEVRQFVTQLDDVIASLQANVPNAHVSLAMTAGLVEPPAERVQRPPTLRESIEAALLTVRVADDIATREALLRTIVDTLGAGTGEADLLEEARHRLDDELGADRAYAALSADLTGRAEIARRKGDVATLSGLLGEMARRDAALGSRRPEAVRALADELAAKLVVARTFRAALDRYAVERPKLLAYERNVRSVMTGLDGLMPVLTAIQKGDFAGYATMERTIARLAAFETSLAAVQPPSDIAAVHAALLSVIHLAREACLRHRQDLVTSSLAGAANASAAAAGAALLLAQARQDLVTHLFPPKGL